MKLASKFGLYLVDRKQQYYQTLTVVTIVLGSGRGLKATQEHTTKMAIMAVCGGGLLACLITGGANRAV